MYRLTADEKAHGKELLAAHPGLRLILWKRDIGASPVKVIRRILIREVVVLGVFVVAYYAHNIIKHEMILKGRIKDDLGCLGDLNEDGSYKMQPAGWWLQ